MREGLREGFLSASLSFMLFVKSGDSFHTNMHPSPATDIFHSSKYVYNEGREGKEAGEGEGMSEAVDTILRQSRVNFTPVTSSE